MDLSDFKRAYVLLALSVASIPLLSAQNENILKGPELLPGGKIDRVKGVYVEFVFTPNDTSHIYLFDSETKPLNNIGISGKIVFQHYDSTVSSYNLIQRNFSEFVFKSNFPTYKFCTVYLEIKGESLSVEFYQNDRYADLAK
jgi:hypothetical protein